MTAVSSTGPSPARSERKTALQADQNAAPADAKVEDLAAGRDWIPIMARYREPSVVRSSVEIAVTAVPLAILWAAAWWSLSISYWLTLVLAVPASVLLVRLFLIQHDCGHGAFFRNARTLTTGSAASSACSR